VRITLSIDYGASSDLRGAPPVVGSGLYHLEKILLDMSELPENGRFSWSLLRSKLEGRLRRTGCAFFALLALSETGLSSYAGTSRSPKTVAGADCANTILGRRILSVTFGQDGISSTIRSAFGSSICRGAKNRSSRALRQSLLLLRLSAVGRGRNRRDPAKWGCTRWAGPSLLVTSGDDWPASAPRSQTAQAFRKSTHNVLLGSR